MAGKDSRGWGGSKHPGKDHHVGCLRGHSSSCSLCEWRPLEACREGLRGCYWWPWPLFTEK